MLQLIEKQKAKYTFIFNNVKCTFIPMALYTGNNLFPLKPYVPKGKSVLKWKVKGKEISYNQIKELIK